MNVDETTMHAVARISLVVVIISYHHRPFLFSYQSRTCPRLVCPMCFLLLQFGRVKSIANTDWTDVDMRKDIQLKLCK